MKSSSKNRRRRGKQQANFLTLSCLPNFQALKKPAHTVGSLGWAAWNPIEEFSLGPLSGDMKKMLDVLDDLEVVVVIAVTLRNSHELIHQDVAVSYKGRMKT